MTDIEPVSRAICTACDENPDHIGDARGNQYRWQDYLDVAQAAIAAMEPIPADEVTAHIRGMGLQEFKSDKPSSN